MKTLKKVVVWSLGILVGSIASVLLVCSLIYSPQYIFRVVRWGDADVYDYQKFPPRSLRASPAVFYFEKNLDENRVRALFEENDLVSNLDEFLARTGTQAFLVIQNDKILYEKYFNGAQRDSLVTSFSVAKSFTSALIGIAIEEGSIGSVEDPITNYLPELAERDPRFSAITIRHLLMMCSGIKYVEYDFFSADDAKTYYYPDLRDLALHHTKILDLPGRYFLYNNYHPLLLGMILERATGTSVTHYLQEKIWTPLRMEFDGSWSLDSEDSGFEKMESGLNARAIDFAKFGRLYLNQGEWNGRQVVPAAWVEESTREDTSIDRSSYYPPWRLFTSVGGYYQYMWWGVRRSEDAYDYYATGNHGQYIYLSPQKKLILVRNGERYGVGSLDWIRLFHGFASGL